MQLPSLYWSTGWQAHFHTPASKFWVTVLQLQAVFSLVLLALIDSHCRCIYVDIGAYGQTSDGGVYNNSSLAVAVEKGELHLPPSSTIPGTDRDMPYIIVGDDTSRSTKVTNHSAPFTPNSSVE